MTKENSFIIFSNENLGSARVVINATKETPEIWLDAEDVCRCLEIDDVEASCANLLDDEKSSIVLNDRTYTIISESGVNALIMKSRRPEAILFQRWVTRNLLVDFRKKGCEEMLFEKESNKQ